MGSEPRTQLDPPVGGPISSLCSHQTFGKFTFCLLCTSRCVRDKEKQVCFSSFCTKWYGYSGKVLFRHIKYVISCRWNLVPTPLPKATQFCRPLLFNIVSGSRHLRLHTFPLAPCPMSFFLFHLKYFLP